MNCGRVLVIEDTWTTGARVWSLAFALKQAGASAIIAGVLARHANPQYEPSRPVLDRIRAASAFDTRCDLDDALPDV